MPATRSSWRLIRISFAVEFSWPLRPQQHDVDVCEPHVAVHEPPLYAGSIVTVEITRVISFR